MSKQLTNSVSKHMKLFKNDSFEIRTVDVDGVTHYVAADFATPLGITNIRNKTKLLDDDEKRLSKIWTTSGKQNQVVLTEPGAYSLILSCPASRKKGTMAYHFRRWVTHELIPAEMQRLQQSIAGLNLQITANEEEIAAKDTQITAKDTQISVKNAQLAVKNSDIRFLEENRLYYVAQSIPELTDRRGWFELVKRRRVTLFKHLIIWKKPQNGGRGVPYIRQGCVDQVVQFLTQ